LSTMSRENKDAEYQARVKEYSREGRLSFQKFAEHKLRGEFKAQAMDKCQDSIKAFAECAEKQGLFVVFNCRKFHKEFQECMYEHNSNEAFERYKEEHKNELDAKVLRT